MKTLHQMWESFTKAIYPNGMVPLQEMQLKDAFFAGADVAFETISWASSQKTEEEAMAILAGFHEEIGVHAAEIAARGSRKN
jgi:hypothetical protein